MPVDSLLAYLHFRERKTYSKGNDASRLKVTYLYKPIPSCLERKDVGIRFEKRIYIYINCVQHGGVC